MNTRYSNALKIKQTKIDNLLIEKNKKLKEQSDITNQFNILLTKPVLYF